MQVLREPTIIFKESEKEAFFYLQLSMDSERVEEIYAFDFNTIVSYLGGSLGLFLGVSCFSAIMYLSGKMMKFWKDTH